MASLKDIFSHLRLKQNPIPKPESLGSRKVTESESRIAAFQSDLLSEASFSKEHGYTPELWQNANRWLEIIQEEGQGYILGKRSLGGTGEGVGDFSYLACVNCSYQEADIPLLNSELPERINQDFSYIKNNDRLSNTKGTALCGIGVTNQELRAYGAEAINRSLPILVEFCYSAKSAVLERGLSPVRLHFALPEKTGTRLARQLQKTPQLIEGIYECWAKKSTVHGRQRNNVPGFLDNQAIRELAEYHLGKGRIVSVRAPETYIDQIQIREYFTENPKKPKK